MLIHLCENCHVHVMIVQRLKMQIIHSRAIHTEKHYHWDNWQWLCSAIHDPWLWWQAPRSSSWPHQRLSPVCVTRLQCAVLTLHTRRSHGYFAIKKDKYGGWCSDESPHLSSGSSWRVLARIIHAKYAFANYSINLIFLHACTNRDGGVTWRC